MRSNEVFLKHIQDEVNFLLRETRGLTFDEFMNDEVLKRACARSFEIIGEAAARVSPETQAKHPEFPWSDVIGMRHRVAHGYDDINFDIVWETATIDLPALLQQLEQILSNEKV